MISFISQVKTNSHQVNLTMYYTAADNGPVVIFQCNTHYNGHWLLLQQFITYMYPSMTSNVLAIHNILLIAILVVGYKSLYL